VQSGLSRLAEFDREDNVFDISQNKMDCVQPQYTPCRARSNLDDERNKLSLEINADHVSLAIKTYVHHQVSRLRISKDKQGLQGEIKDRLFMKSDGTFLWVALVVEELRKCQLQEEVLDALNAIPTDLPKLYDQMIDQTNQLTGRRRDLCLTILSMVILAYSPLNLSEMCHLVNLDEVQDMESAVAMCGSFLTNRDSYIYMIHQSAKDHLDKVHATTVILRERSAIHYEMYNQSLRIISKKLHRNIYNLHDAGVSASEMATMRPNPNRYSTYDIVARIGWTFP
jgi:hypothetical protein